MFIIHTFVNISLVMFTKVCMFALSTTAKVSNPVELSNHLKQLKQLAMKKKDNQLVKDGKINRIAVMTRAWHYVQQHDYTLECALCESWQAACEKLRQYHWRRRVEAAARHKTDDPDYNPYNNKDIPSSAFYSATKGLMGAHYVGD